MKKKKIWKRNYLLFGLGLGLIITSVISTTFLNKNNSILKNQNQLATNNNIDNSINLFSTEDDIRNFVHAKFEEIQKQIDLNNRKTYARHAVEPINSYLNDFFIKNEFTVNKLRSYVDDYSGTLSLAYSVSKQNFTLSEEYNFYNFCIRETYKQIGEKLDKKLNEIQEQISLNGNSVYASDAKEPLELFIRDFINNQNNNWVLQNLPITIDDSKGKITFDFAIFKKGANNDDLTYWGTRTFTGFKIKSTQNDILNQISAKFIEIQNKITLQGNLVFASEAKNSIETAIKSFFEKNNLQIKLFEIIDDDFNGSIKIDYQVSDGKIVAEGSIKFIGFKVKQNGEEIKDLISAKFIEIQNQITLQAKSHLPSQAKSSVETTIRNFFEENNLGVESLVITDDDSKGSLEVTYKVFEKIVKNTTTYIEGSIIFEGFISNGLNEQAIKTEILNKFSEIQTQINSETNSIFASDAKTTIETTVKQFFVDNNFEIQILVIEIDDAKGILKINYRVSKNNILVENVQDLNGFAINNNSFPVDSIQPGLSNNNQLSTPIIILISVATFVVLLAIILLVLWKNKVFSSKKNKLYLANYKNKKFDSSKLKSNAIVPISKKNNLYKTSNYNSLVTAKTKNISTIPLLTSKNLKSNLKTKELVPYKMLTSSYSKSKSKTKELVPYKKHKGINSPIRTTNYSSKTKPLS